MLPTGGNTPEEDELDVELEELEELEDEDPTPEQSPNAIPAPRTSRESTFTRPAATLALKAIVLLPALKRTDEDACCHADQPPVPGKDKFDTAAAPLIKTLAGRSPSPPFA